MLPTACISLASLQEPKTSKNAREKAATILGWCQWMASCKPTIALSNATMRTKARHPLLETRMTSTGSMPETKLPSPEASLLWKCTTLGTISNLLCDRGQSLLFSLEVLRKLKEASCHPTTLALIQTAFRPLWLEGILWSKASTFLKFKKEGDWL